VLQNTSTPLQQIDETEQNHSAFCSFQKYLIQILENLFSSKLKDPSNTLNYQQKSLFDLKNVSFFSNEK